MRRSCVGQAAKCDCYQSHERSDGKQSKRSVLCQDGGCCKYDVDKETALQETPLQLGLSVYYHALN